MEAVWIDFGSYYVAVRRQVRVQLSHTTSTQSKLVLHLTSLHVYIGRTPNRLNKHEKKKRTKEMRAQKFGIESVALTTTQYLLTLFSAFPLHPRHVFISQFRSRETKWLVSPQCAHRNNFIRHLLLIRLLLPSPLCLPPVRSFLNSCCWIPSPAMLPECLIFCEQRCVFYY